MWKPRTWQRGPWAGNPVPHNLAAPREESPCVLPAGCLGLSQQHMESSSTHRSSPGAWNKRTKPVWCRALLPSAGPRLSLSFSTLKPPKPWDKKFLLRSLCIGAGPPGTVQDKGWRGCVYACVCVYVCACTSSLKNLLLVWNSSRYLSRDRCAPKATKRRQITRKAPEGILNIHVWYSKIH